MLKTAKIAIISLLLLFIACRLEAQTQRQQRTVGSFSSVDIEGGFTVYLIQGDEEKVVIESEVADVFSSVTCSNSAGTLLVRTQGIVTGGSYKVSLYVFFRSIDKLSARLMTGSLYGYSALNLDRFELRVDGAMNVKMNLNCYDLQLNLNSVYTTILQGTVNNSINMNLAMLTSFFASNLQTQSLTVSCNNVKKANVWATRDISVDASGMGTLYYRGTATESSMTVREPFSVVKE